MEIFKTDYQRKMEKRHEKILALYGSLMHEQPQMKTHRACTIIGLQVGMTANGVKKVLTAAGIYTPAAQNSEK